MMGDKNKEITLENLCGVHLLQGFELTEQNIERYGSLSECDVVKFMLDGITYIAIEDPDDGYRSYCDEIKVSSEKPKYSIPNCEVSCAMKQDDSGYVHDVLVGTDTHTGLIVFEIGTMCVGDWYPYCHFEYHPENMFCNEQRRVNNSPMTLDEAIQHCRDKENCSKCGQEHKQLREWLEELKERRANDEPAD